MPTEQDVIAAVERYAYDRHRGLTPFNVMGIDEEDLERVTTTKDGYLKYTIEDVEITGHEDDTWYVNATLWFKVESGEPVECGTDIYECWVSGDGSLEVDWYGE